jgi:hypothetical protein
LSYVLFHLPIEDFHPIFGYDHDVVPWFDNQRAVKYREGTGSETLYFNNMWQKSTGQGYEVRHQYWYHGYHLGSAQMLTDVGGKQHERVDYTPYGETWIDQIRGE